MAQETILSPHRQRIQSDIVYAFIQLLHEREFVHLTVKDVCKKAGISRGTFYRHFMDKYSLLKAFMLHMTLEIERACGSGSYEKKIDCIFSCLGKYKVQLKHLLFGTVDYEVHIIVYTLYANEIRGELESRLGKGERFALPVRVLADFCASGISFIMIQWLRGEYKYSREELAKYIFRLASTVHMVEEILEVPPRGAQKDT